MVESFAERYQRLRQLRSTSSLHAFSDEKKSAFLDAETAFFCDLAALAGVKPALVLDDPGQIDTSTDAGKALLSEIGALSGLHKALILQHMGRLLL